VPRPSDRLSDRILQRLRVVNGQFPAVHAETADVELELYKIALKVVKWIAKAQEEAANEEVIERLAVLIGGRSDPVPMVMKGLAWWRAKLADKPHMGSLSKEDQVQLFKVMGLAEQTSNT
jgi:hypothetical protein